MRTKTALKEREKQNNPKSQCELKSIRGRKHSKGNIEPRAMVFHKKPSKSQFYFSSSTLLSVLKVHIKKLQMIFTESVYQIKYFHSISKKSSQSIFTDHVCLKRKILFSLLFVREKHFLKFPDRDVSGQILSY